MSNIEAIARRYLDSVNERDWDAMRNVMHPEYSYTGGDGRRVEGGPDVGIAVSKMFIGAMSDAHIAVDRIHAAGGVTILECTGTGTHDGKFGNIQPTQTRVSMPVCIVLEFKDGKVFTEREYMDMAHLFQQMGATSIPQPATA